MGSRRRRHAALTAALILALAACGSSHRPDGPGAHADRWTIPLVGPLEDGLLVASVTIDGRGTWLFQIDPDAAHSAIDEEVVKSLALTTSKGTSHVGESGTAQPRFDAHLPSIELGSLVIESKNALIVRAQHLVAQGRVLHGILGRDILTDAFVLGIDRDRGVAHLVMREAFTPPAGAIRVPLTAVPGRGTGPRRVVDATIHDEPFRLAIDLGSIHSGLRESLWSRAKLEPRDTRGGYFDEIGAHHLFERIAIAPAVTVASVRTDRITIIPFIDARLPDATVDGTLGLGFLRAHDLWLDGASNTLYLTPRTAEPLATRLERWDVGAFGTCKQPGCVSVRTVDPLAGKPLDPAKPHPGILLSVVREDIAGGMDLEVILEPHHRPDLPRLIANLGPDAERAMIHLDATWRDVTLDVIDASPHPRTCPSGSACIDKLAR